VNLSSIRAHVWTWLALLALLAATTASSFLPLGRFNLFVNLTIAALKGLLVAWVFMRISRSGPAVALAALAGIGWLALLAVLSLADFAARFG
jgi:cytochrome c oxidase subunit IV